MSFEYFSSDMWMYPKGIKTERRGSCELHICVIYQKSQSGNFTVIYEV